MDEDSSFSLLITLLLFLEVWLTLSYAALTNVRTNRLKEQADEGNKAAGRMLLVVTEQMPQVQLTYQFSKLLLHMAIAVLAFLWLSEVLAPTTTVPVGLIYIVVYAAMAIVLLLIGDLVPESIGAQYAETLARFIWPAFRLLYLLMRPVVWLLLVSGRLVSSAFGSGGKVSQVTEEEIMTLVDAGHTGGTIEEEEREMIFSVLQLDETYAREVMTPRMDIVALNVNTSIQDALAKFIESGFSRIPVYEESVDNIIGLLYAKDLLKIWLENNGDNTSIRDLLRPAYFVPESKRIDELLKELQSQKVHMAIVVDEYGGTAGLVTIENLVEEIIGDIQDEYDKDEEAEYTQLGDNEWMVDASIDLDDFNNLCQVGLPTDESDTLGGYIFVQLGRLPTVGETIETSQLELRVDSLEGRRIRKVYVRRLSPDEQEEADTIADKAQSADQQAS